MTAPVIDERQASGMNAGFVTIGHSNRTSQTVIEMLRDAQVGLLADVRAFPRSRANPAFNIDSFPAQLSTHNIGYRHFPVLGGRRSRLPEVDETVNAFWRVRTFHNYADYALGDEFQAALRDLEQLGEVQRLALMCSEALWWRCHRRIIADYLLAAGHDVVHLMAPGKVQRATLSKGAEVRADGRLTYPAVDEHPTGSSPQSEPAVPLCRHEELAHRENQARARKRATRK
jgi:uncharacterized protein (DUF488 family)